MLTIVETQFLMLLKGTLQLLIFSVDNASELITKIVLDKIINIFLHAY